MESLIEYFTNNVGTDRVWTAFLLLAIYYVLKKEPFKVFAHFTERKDKEHELARTLLESEKLGEEANAFLREHLERSAFRKYYGIAADADMRSALLRFHNAHQRELGWHDLRRAYPNIRLNGTQITARLGLFDHVLRWNVTILCGLVGAYALFVVGYAIVVVGTANKGEFFALTVTALLLLVATVFFSTMNWPYHSTRKIITLSARDTA